MNCNKETCSYILLWTDLNDMSKMILRTNGPKTLPDGYKLCLHMTQTDAESARVFRNKTSGQTQSNALSKLL